MDVVKSSILAMLRGSLDSTQGVVLLFQNSQSIDKEYSSSSSSSTKSGDYKPIIASLKEKEKSKVLKRTFQCCALNGGVFLLSMLFIEHGVLPSFKILFSYIFPDDSNFGVYVWSWMKPFLTLIFGMFWILPIFVLSKIVNSLWFQDIADSAYRYTRGRPKLMPNLSRLIADILFSLVVQSLFLIQSVVISLVPIAFFGKILYMVHIAMLYSLYSFEYKWFNMGWELHKRLSYIELNWPYFIGFGLPLAVMTELPSSYLISGCIFSILFPFLIMSGSKADPIEGSCSVPLKVFSLVIAVSNAMFTSTIKITHNRPASTR